MAIKRVVGNKVDIGLLLEFEKAFPGEQRLLPEQYLAGGSRNTILKAATFFLGFKAMNSKFDDPKVLLEAIFSPENNQFANELYGRIRALEKNSSAVGIINPVSSLKLFEYFFSQENQEQTQSEAEFERNLFKAYLVLNSEFTAVQQNAFSSTENLDGELKIPMMLFSMQYPVSDKANYDIQTIWVAQAMKAIYLFEFLESNARTQSLLAAFLAHYGCTTWQEYLKRLLHLTISAAKQKHEAHTDISVQKGERFEEDCAFIEKLIVSERDPLAKDDFLTLREKPFYKVENGVYRIIFNLFVVEKIFKGLYFQLREINGKLPANQRMKEFRSFYGDEFSEKILLYKVMESIYPGKCTRFSGKELDARGIDGAPDYYVRKYKHILLTESKDFLIDAGKKASFDFTVYETEFEKKLYFEDEPNGNQKHKGVMQLIANVRRILKKEFPADIEYHYRDVYIYPALITHDLQYDVPGFNHLLNHWFQAELEALAEEGLFIHHVKPLVVINIDSLLYNQVGLAQDIPLHEVIDAYEKHITIDPRRKFSTIEDHQEYLFSKMIPFSLFIDSFLYERGVWKPPPVLETVGLALFKEEFENKKIANK